MNKYFIFAVTTLFSEDSLFGFFVAYVCGQFTILHGKIENVIDSKFTKKDSKLSVARNDKHVTREFQLKRIIDHHNRIAKYMVAYYYVEG